MDSGKEYHRYQTRSYFVKKNNHQHVNGVSSGKITKQPFGPAYFAIWPDLDYLTRLWSCGLIVPMWYDFGNSVLFGYLAWLFGFQCKLFERKTR